MKDLGGIDRPAINYVREMAMHPDIGPFDQAGTLPLFYQCHGYETDPAALL